MKKCIFFAATLLLLTMASCQKNEITSENEGEATSVNLKPISIGLYTTSSSSLLGDGDTCFLINSSEAMEPKYFGDQKIPKVDFEKQTLLLGRVQDYPGCVLEKQSVNVTDDFVIVNLVVKRGLSVYHSVVGYYFWGIYDKLPDKKVVLEKKILIREDSE